MRVNQFYILLLLLFLQVSGFSQNYYRKDLNDWHWQHDDRYRELDSLHKKKNPGANQSTGATPTLYNFNCQDLWLSGANIAWNKFGRDVGNSEMDITYFENMFDDVKAAGGNSMRWWLHTNISFTPIIDGTGYVSGLGTDVISDILLVLDAAEERDIAIDICLFSFDMLQNQWEMDANANKNLLTSATNIQSYIDNALTPMVNAIKDHPALLCWEIFNEPEGMTNEFGWTPTRVDMYDVQRFVNMVTGAIHRLDSENPVTNGSWSFRALTDILTGTDEMNYYRDDRLIAAGGDSDGTLDFYQVHYYSWAGTALSPFHNDKSYWNLDKELMVAEFHVEDTYGVLANDLFDELYHRGYFGGWGWQYNESTLWADINPALQAMYADHSSDLTLDFTNGCGSVPPTVSLTSPSHSSTFEAPVDITVSADASDSDGTITQVEFFANGMSIGTDASSPYSISWNVSDTGTYVIKAVATDNHDLNTTSDSITISVTYPLDCNGDANGTASIDACGVCSGGNTGNTPNESCTDCNGDVNGTASVDACGICSGGNTGNTPNESCTDCNGDVNGTASEDVCGVCSGGNTGITPITDANDCVTSVDQGQSSGVAIYPNPTEENVYLSISVDWSLYTMTGQKIMSGSGNTIEMKNIPSGLYLIKAEGQVYKITKL